MPSYSLLGCRMYSRAPCLQLLITHFVVTPLISGFDVLKHSSALLSHFALDSLYHMDIAPSAAHCLLW